MTDKHADNVGAGTKPAPTLKLSGVTKRFGSVIANSRVDLEIHSGEIHALLGENGAGKTTLMEITYGLVAPDEGHLEMEGERVPWPTARETISRGIGMVHQHFMLVPTLTVGENIFLNVMSMPSGRDLKMRSVLAELKALGEEYGMVLDSEAYVDELSVGERLRLELLKVLLQGRLQGGLRAFILDEPTALLTKQEIEDLFSILRQLADAGTAIVIITHKLDEVMEYSDRVTVLRAGERVRTMPTSMTSQAELGRLMVGGGLPTIKRASKGVAGEVVLSVEELSYQEDGHRLLDAVSFEIHRSEILGVAGVAGNGQDILVECITRLRDPSSGRITLKGRDITRESRRVLVESGVAHVPEDRRTNGLVASASLTDNFVLGLQRRPEFCRHGLAITGRIREHSERLKGAFGVRTGGLDQPAASLSGGNQQRLVMGRELSKEPEVIVASGPTRGLDIAGCDYVQERLVEQRDAGAAILLVSLDLDELLTLSDRLLVIQAGRITGEMESGDADPERLGLMMGGSAERIVGSDISREETESA